MLGASRSRIPALRQISSGSRSVSFDTSCTMLRAAWPRRCPQPSRLRLKGGCRSQHAAPWTPSVRRPRSSRPSAPGRPSDRAARGPSRARSCARGMRRGLPARTAESPLQGSPGRICHRRSTSDSSTASAWRRRRSHGAAPPAEQRGGMWLLASSGCPVHAFELTLERVVEQLVPVLSEKPEQRPYTPRQPLHQHLLLRRL